MLILVDQYVSIRSVPVLYLTKRTQMDSVLIAWAQILFYTSCNREYRFLSDAPDVPHYTAMPNLYILFLPVQLPRMEFRL